MLNDATCFKAVYIVCGYTDLRSGMDRLAALVEAQTGDRPYSLIHFIFSVAGGQTASKDLYGRGTDGSYYIRDFQKAGFNGPAVHRGCVP